MTTINDQNFAEIVLESAIPVVVVFSAAWCSPCKALEPTVQQLSEQYAGRVLVVKADIEQARAASQANGVRSVPTAVAFRGGETLNMIGGSVPPARLTALVKSLAA